MYQPHPGRSRARTAILQIRLRRGTRRRHGRPRKTRARRQLVPGIRPRSRPSPVQHPAAARKIAPRIGPCVTMVSGMAATATADRRWLPQRARGSGGGRYPLDSVGGRWQPRACPPGRGVSPVETMSPTTSSPSGATQELPLQASCALPLVRVLRLCRPRLWPLRRHSRALLLCLNTSPHLCSRSTALWTLSYVGAPLRSGGRCHGCRPGHRY